MFSNWPRILKLAGPSIISFASVTLTGTLTLIVLGDLGALVIAIVGVSNIIMYNAFALFSGIGHTVNYLVAQNYGAGEMKQGIERTYIALYFALSMSVLIILTGIFFATDILRIVGGSESQELIQGGDYLQLRFFAMGCALLTFVLQGFFRGIGDTISPMVISLIANVCIIGLTFGLAYGRFGLPEMGLQGAGWAFLIGESIALLLCAYVYFIKLHPRFGTRMKTIFRPQEARLIFAESGKLGVQEFSLSFSMLIFTMFVAKLGYVALAANEVALNVMSVGFMPAFAFGATATILVGQEVGRGNLLQAKRLGTDTAILGSIFLLLLGTLEFVFAMPIAKMYADDAAVYELTALLIMISAYLQIFDGFLNFYAGGLRGIGETSFLWKTSFVCGIFLFIPLAYLFIFVLDWGSVGAWVSFYTFLTVLGMSMMIRFYKTDWLRVRLKGTSEHSA